MQINSKDGRATVSLNVELVCLPSSPSPSQAEKPKRRKRSPAYYRRQDRRKEEASKLKATSAKVVVVADPPNEGNDSDSVEIVTEAVKDVSEAVKNDTEKDFEVFESVTEIESDVCAVYRLKETEISHLGSPNSSKGFKKELHWLIMEHRLLWTPAKQRSSI